MEDPRSPAMPPLGPPYAAPHPPPPPTFPPGPPAEWPWLPPLPPTPPPAPSGPGGTPPRDPDDLARRRALVLAAIGAVVVMLIAVLAWSESGSSNGRFVVGATTTTTAPVASDSSSDSSTSGSSSSDSSPSDLPTTIEDIKAFVERERGLTFKSDVQVQLVGDNELAQRLDSELTDEQANIAETQQVFRVLGLVPADFDLTGAERTLLDAAVVGFYDAKTKQLVVRGTSVTPYVREVLAHELTHALDDQWFGLDRPQLDNADDETGFAFDVLAEGDATRVELAYVDSMSSKDQTKAIAEQDRLALQHPEILDLPSVVLDLTQEPYVAGPPLIDAILAAGGQPRLDAAFVTPPVTSAQVLDPSKFLAGEGPVPVPVPSPDGALSNRGVLGAVVFRELLDGALPSNQVDRAVAGWGGDDYVTWVALDGSTCLRDTFVGDTPADTASLAQALGTWATGERATVDAPDGAPGTFTICR